MVIDNLADIQAFRSRSGASSVMVARAAEWNCSVFRSEGRLEYDDVMKSYLRYVSHKKESFLF